MQKGLQEKKTTGEPLQSLRNHCLEVGELVLLVDPLRSKKFKVRGEAFIGYFGGYAGRTEFNLRFAHGLDVPKSFFDNDGAYDSSSMRAPEFTLPSLFSVPSEYRSFPTLARKIYAGEKRVKKALREDKELRALIYPSFNTS